MGTKKGYVLVCVGGRGYSSCILWHGARFHAGQQELVGFRFSACATLGEQLRNANWCVRVDWQGKQFEEKDVSCGFCYSETVRAICQRRPLRLPKRFGSNRFDERRDWIQTRRAPHS